MSSMTAEKEMLVGIMVKAAQVLAKVQLMVSDGSRFGNYIAHLK